MVNTDLINASIQQKGLKLKFIADKLGMSSTALRKKINNAYEFKVSEAVKLCEILGLDGIQLKNNIFLLWSFT